MQTYVQIETDSGIIQGAAEDVLGKPVERFIGIPYGLPPIGELRFKKPVSNKKWTGVKFCTAFKCAPWQKLIKNFENEHSGESVWNPKEKCNEDCLHLNIWRVRPDTADQDNKNRPVMVWFYGGGFVTGATSLSIYDGSILASQSQVIIASVNYRVGSLGFLYLNDDAPGNQGLWDQLLALKWIKKNIAKFGGDPDNITLFGESAGAVSVCCHILSPYSAPYFDKAIMQSGCALNHWAVLSKDEMKRRAQLLCQNLGFDLNKASNEQLKDLQQTEAHVLVDKEWVCEGALQYPWTPIVDYDFLPDVPEVLFSQKRFKQCPIIIGNTEHEGSYFLLYEDLLMNYVKDKDKISQSEFNEVIKLTFPYYPNYPNISTPLILKRISDQYSPIRKDESLEECLIAAGQALGHCQLTHHTLTLARLCSADNDSIYLYHFNHHCQNDPWPSWTGVKHADEIQFVFGAPLKFANYSEYEKRVSFMMTLWWTTFAKYGKPVCEDAEEWLPFDNDKQFCLYIGADMKMDKYHLTEIHDFWHATYENYAKTLS